MIQSYNELLKSSEFKSWIAKHKNAYLSSCVSIYNPQEKEIWNFDFYIPKINKITTFTVGEEISLNEEQKIFEQSHKKLKQVDLNKIKFDLEKVKKIVDKKFEKVKILKTFIILQFLKELIWKVSLLGNDFKLNNIKIDAINGKVIEESSTSMLQFKAS